MEIRNFCRDFYCHCCLINLEFIDTLLHLVTFLLFRIDLRVRPLLKNQNNSRAKKKIPAKFLYLRPATLDMTSNRYFDPDDLDHHVSKASGKISFLSRSSELE